MVLNKNMVFNPYLIRDDFPILHTQMNGKPLVFLDNAASSQKPQVVIDAMNDYYQSQHANVHRGVYQLSQKATDAFEAARKNVASFLNAKYDREIIFVRGATEAINLVASSFSKKFLHSGDEILISAMEHHSNIVPWQMACENTGATLKVIPVNNTGEIDMEAFQNLLSPQTKLVALVHISNTLGTINPIQEVIEKAHQLAIPVLIDGAQATPHLKVDVQELDADFYVFSGHKVYGPTGIGVLYGKEKWLNALPPYQGGGEMIESVSFEKTTYNELPFKFEAGTPDIAGAVGLNAAINYLQQIDIVKAGEWEQELLEYATLKLRSVEGLRLIGTAATKASVISFVIEGIHPFDVGTILDKLGIAVRTGHHCTQPLMSQFQLPGTVRASFAFYNTKEEIDLFVDGVIKAKNMLS
jgi:cysteine desulfurase/selenocysteine lyase